VSNFIGDEYYATAEINAGYTYMIRIRARNYWGWGDFSEIITIKASTVPAQVDTPVTSIEAVTGGIRVTWTEPDNKSDTITAYLIEAQLPSFEWAEICDGTDSTIVTNQGCIIPMSTFWEASTYNKEYNDLVQFRVTAYNVNGWGESSSPNTEGALVYTVPSYMF
jgi:hypothetical protein